MQVFGARVVGVGHQRGRVRLFDGAVEPVEKSLNLAPAVPAHDRGTDLVADAERHVAAYHRFDVAGALPVIEKRRRALDWNSDQHAQPVLLREVQQPARRNGVGADGVASVRGHRGEIPADDRLGRELDAARVWSERPVGDAAHVEFLRADPEEFSFDPRPLDGRWPVGARYRRGLDVGRHLRRRPKHWRTIEFDPLSRTGEVHFADSLGIVSPCIPYRTALSNTLQHPRRILVPPPGKHHRSGV